MLVLGRSKGERIEINGHALIRVARIEAGRVRLDVTAPWSRTRRGEQASAEGAGRTAVVCVLGIRRRGDSDNLRAAIGIRVPSGSSVQRAEVANQTQAASQRFPWHRYQPTARYWRAVNEEIHISLS